MKFTGYYVALRTKHDISLGRDFALIGTKFGLPLDNVDQCKATVAEHFNTAEYVILSGEQLKKYKPRKQRLDTFLTENNIAITIL